MFDLKIGGFRDTLPLLIALCWLVPVSYLVAQEAEIAENETLMVFLDCQTGCDFDHLRRAITFVNWVRDRADAQVHVLVSVQRTGAGGNEYSLNLVGLQQFAGMEDEHSHVSRATDTDDEERNGIARALALGLARYAMATPVARSLRIVHDATYEQQRARNVGEGDPWNFWVFGINAGVLLRGEESFRQRTLDFSFDASRINESSKIVLEAYGIWMRDEYDLNDEETIVNARHNLGLDGLLTWSIGEHWSTGGIFEVRSETFYNQDLSVEIVSALEYDVFPYSQSSDRMLTLRYSFGARWLDYEQVTIFDRTSEVRPLHILDVDISATQRWGRVSVSLYGIQYLHDLARHRFGTDANVDWRLYKGLTLNVTGWAVRVKDQIYLPAGDATEEEILLRRRQLGTDYQYSARVGLRFTFGSIFNNVVNPRFPR